MPTNDNGEDNEAMRPATKQVALSIEERRLVNIFRQLPVAKQHAVIYLLMTTLRNPQDAPPTYYKNPWTSDGRNGPVMNDDNDDARTQHQRALLHDAPQPAPRQQIPANC